MEDTKTIQRRTGEVEKLGCVNGAEEAVADVLVPVKQGGMERGEVVKAQIRTVRVVFHGEQTSHHLVSHGSVVIKTSAMKGCQSPIIGHSDEFATIKLALDAGDDKVNGFELAKHGGHVQRGTVPAIGREGVSACIQLLAEQANLT